MRRREIEEFLFLGPKNIMKTKNMNKIKNDIKVLSVEHKLGHNASPTCVLSFEKIMLVWENWLEKPIKD